MAFMTVDAPEFMKNREKRYRAQVGMTKPFLEGAFFDGHKIVSIHYDTSREIITFYFDMQGDEAFFTPEGQECVQADWDYQTGKLTFPGSAKR